MGAKQATENRIETFEKSLADLEALVEQLEKGELSLEDSLQQFERGVKLARACQTSLKQAELKVRQLVEKDGQAALEDLPDPEASSE